jgi:hypothetical protein
MTAQIIQFKPRPRRRDVADQIGQLCQLQAIVADAAFIASLNLLRAMYGLPPLTGGDR